MFVKLFLWANMGNDNSSKPKIQGPTENSYGLNDVFSTEVRKPPLTGYSTLGKNHSQFWKNNFWSFFSFSKKWGWLECHYKWNWLRMETLLVGRIRFNYFCLINWCPRILTPKKKTDVVVTKIADTKITLLILHCATVFQISVLGKWSSTNLQNTHLLKFVTQNQCANWFGFEVWNGKPRNTLSVL